jgi:hypothetical protein
MLTYNKTVEEPRLQIMQDPEPINLREQDGMLGVLVIKNWQDPDAKEEWDIALDIYKNEYVDNVSDHMESLKKRTGAMLVYPISKYEHTGVRYFRGASSGWEYGITGFYLVYENEETKNMSEEQIENIIDGEMEEFTKFANGEYLYFVLFDTEGNLEDSLHNIPDLECLRDHLPKEFENEDLTDYIVD